MGADRTITRRVLIVAALVLVAAVLIYSGPTDSPTDVTGIVISVDGDLTAVSTFEVLSEGTVYRFEPAPNGTFAFPLGHLRDHLRSGEPVLVEFVASEATLIATAISDSP